MNKNDTHRAARGAAQGLADLAKAIHAFDPEMRQAVSSVMASMVEALDEIDPMNVLNPSIKITPQGSAVITFERPDLPHLDLGQQYVTLLLPPN